MDIIKGDFYQENCNTKESALINFNYNTANYQIYEVIRTTSGVLLFIEDHLERLSNSLISLGIKINLDKYGIKACLKELVKLNGYKTGNVKLVCRTGNNELQHAAYYIPHAYPTNEMYRYGVSLATYKIERPEPNIKQIHVSEYIRREIKNTRMQTGAYEVLLVDNNGYITEGSKSNIFFVSKGELYSPPEEFILPGITRNYVLKIALREGIEICKTPIRYTEICKYDSAFICGTSSKILPVKKIDNNNLRVNNEINNLILISYNIIIQNYIEKN